MCGGDSRDRQHWGHEEQNGVPPVAGKDRECCDDEADDHERKLQGSQQSERDGGGKQQNQILRPALAQLAEATVHAGTDCVATNLLEDVALARAVKATGRKIFFRFGGDAVRTRMYRTFSQLREGWTKNLALLFPSPKRLASLRLLEFLLIIGSFAAVIFEVIQHRSRAAIAASILCVVLFDLFLGRIKKAHFPFKANAVAIFGLPMFAYLLLRSRLSYKQGKVQWKGRTYAGSEKNHVGIGAAPAQAECNEAVPHHISI